MSLRWFKIFSDLPGHRKTRRLSTLLRRPRAHHLILDLWCWVAEEKPSGDLTGIDSVAIAANAGWEGDPDQFVEALFVAGFLDRATRKVHDWDQINGAHVEAAIREEVAQPRASEGLTQAKDPKGAERQRRYRERHARHVTAPSVTGDGVGDGDRNGVTVPPTPPSKEKGPEIEEHTPGARDVTPPVTGVTPLRVTVLPGDGQSPMTSPHAGPRHAASRQDPPPRPRLLQAFEGDPNARFVQDVWSEFLRRNPELERSIDSMASKVVAASIQNRLGYYGATVEQCIKAVQGARWLWEEERNKAIGKYLRELQHIMGENHFDSCLARFNDGPRISGRRSSKSEPQGINDIWANQPVGEAMP